MLMMPHRLRSTDIQIQPSFSIQTYSKLVRHSLLTEMRKFRQYLGTRTAWIVTGSIPSGCGRVDFSLSIFVEVIGQAVASAAKYLKVKG